MNEWTNFLHMCFFGYHPLWGCCLKGGGRDIGGGGGGGGGAGGREGDGGGGGKAVRIDSQSSMGQRYPCPA